MKQVVSHVVREADGFHESIPVRIDEFRLQHNGYGGIEWTDRTETVVCRRVGEQWQAVVERNGLTRALLPGLGSQNHALWLAREYMEFGRTYDTDDVWNDLPPREQSNPFRDILSTERDTAFV
ncbi:hypothetical protein [Haladaptatus cibarius]|uniref:hypothetical protein n=1 Tax=Haladaptatus cibarius TaxID=453847 RepID=UPI0006797187|nr:hypothetical protein [Haladaptatus cibarius]